MRRQGLMQRYITPRKTCRGESGRPGSNRRRPAWEAFLALAGQGFFGGGSRRGITQYGPLSTASFRPARSSSSQEGRQMTSLRGKVAVVTGASSGVGKATVMALVSEGARVIGVARGEAGLAALGTEMPQRLDKVRAESSEPRLAE